MSKKHKLTLIGLGAALLGGVGLLGLESAAVGQQQPSDLPGCIYNATPPTLSDKQSIALQCDANGKIITH